MIPLSTLRSGARLVLHGLSVEMLHAYLVLKKREQARDAAAGATSPQKTYSPAK
jgi:hypothetical protein